MEEWQHTSNYALPEPYKKASGQHHATAALPSAKEPPVPTEYKVGWTTDLAEHFVEDFSLKNSLLIENPEVHSHVLRILATGPNSKPVTTVTN
jgi:hypothetical protein